MTIKEELKERMRLYEMYSTAALTGLLLSGKDWRDDELVLVVDEVAREMISCNLAYSDIHEENLNDIYRIKKNAIRKKPIRSANLRN